MISLYEKAGVREYWIVNPDDKMVTVYNFEGGKHSIDTYTFDEKVKAGIYESLEIDFKDVKARITE